jgi:hypothetical protein
MEGAPFYAIAKPCHIVLNRSCYVILDFFRKPNYWKTSRTLSSKRQAAGILGLRGEF